MSSIINFRLTTLIETYGLDEQFGHTPGKGTTDALFAIRTALQLRREHQFPTYAVFVDLIKAFDTANHDLLFALLLRFGASEGLVDIIRRLHRDFETSSSSSCYKNSKPRLTIQLVCAKRHHGGYAISLPHACSNRVPRTSLE
jgi:hypothetical protein